jgi:hypothetical protein
VCISLMSILDLVGSIHVLKNEKLCKFSLFLKAKVENLLSCSIKTIQCDGGLKFKSLQNLFHAITF